MPTTLRRSRPLTLLWCFLLLGNLLPMATPGHAQAVQDAAARFWWQRQNIPGRRSLPDAPAGVTPPVVAVPPVDQQQRLAQLQARAAAEQNRERSAPDPIAYYTTYVPLAGDARTTASPDAAITAPVELPAYRTATSRTYQLPNDRWRTEIASQPIHYQARDQWLPYAPTLQPAAQTADSPPAYRVHGTDLDLRFVAPTASRPLPPDRHLVDLRAGELTLGWTPQHVRLAQATTDGAQITYQNVLDGVDLRYTATGPGVKEDLIFARPPASDFTFRSTLQIAGGTLVQDGQRILVLDQAGRQVWTISAPFLIDVQGATTPDVRVALQPRGAGHYTLTYTPSAAWLADPARAYPVTLDPTLTATLSGDTYAASSDLDGDQHHAENSMLLGSSPSGATRRLYLQFSLPWLPTGITAADITDATLRLYQYQDDHGGAYNVTLYRTIDLWVEADVNGTNEPGRAATPSPIAATVRAGANFKSFAVTTIAQAWYANPQPSGEKGLTIVMANEAQAGGRFATNQCAPSDSPCHDGTTAEVRPLLTVDYTIPQARRNELYLTQSLTFSPQAAAPQNATVTATFTVKNTGNRRVRVPRFRVGMTRLSTGQPDHFPATAEIELTPGESYTYTRSRTFADAGRYEGRAEFFDGNSWQRIYIPKDSTTLANTRQYTIQSSRPPRHARTLGTRGKNGRAGEPVNTSTGNFSSTAIDATLTDAGLSIALGRTFNSLDTATVGSFGPGWAATYAERLIRQEDESVIAVRDDGQQVFFAAGFREEIRTTPEDDDGDIGEVVYTPDGSYTTDDGGDLTLARNLTTGAWTLTDSDFTVTTFDADGRWQTITDRSGSTLTATYTGAELASVRSANHTCTFGWTNSRVTAIACPTGTLLYTYDGTNRVQQATDLTGAVTSYSYDDSHRITRITDGAGRLVVENVYDAEGRVAQQREGSTTWTTFNYNDGTRTTTYVAADGQQLTDTYDERDRLLQRVDALGQTERYTYDADDHLLTYTNALNATWAYTYDANGNVLTETDPLGATWTYTYDARNQRTSATDPLGHTTRSSYTGAQLTAIENPLGGQRRYETTPTGLVLSETNELGHTIRRTYTATGQIASETDALGATTTYAYNAAGDMIAITDALGHTVRSTYDADHRVTRIEAADGSVTQFTYDAVGNLVRETNPLGAARQFVYDGNHRLIGETDFTGAVTEYFYDEVGRLRRTVDALNQATTQTYDAAGRLAARTDRTGATWTFTYDAAGQVIAETDPLGRQIRHEYDAAGREIRTIDARGNAVSRTYDPLDRVLTETSRLGAVTTMTYDPLGRLISETDALGKTTRYEYDAAGRSLRTIDALGNVSTAEYDPNGRILKEIDRLGAVTAYRYDRLGWLIATTDRRGGVTETRYDAQDRPTLVIDALGNRTATVYDAAGRRLREIDPRGVSRSWTYDAQGRVLTATDGVGATTTTEYDALGSPIRVTDALGGVRQIAYDAEGRVTAETNAAGQTRTTTYDAVGNAVRVTDPRGFAETTTYDPNDNPVAVTDALGGITRTEYNADNQSVVVIDALGHHETTEYDRLGRVTATRDPYGATTRTAYDALGRPLSTTDPRGAITRTEYDAEGRVVREINALGHATTTAYDSDDAPLTITDPLGRRARTEYDLLGRAITEIDALGFVTRTEYDAAGNVARTIDPRGAITSFRYDNENRQIAQIDAANHVWRTEYDLLGRAIRRIDPLGNATITDYDAVGNPIKITQPGGQALRLVYDAANNLIAQMDGRGFVTTMAYDARNRRTATTDPLGHTTRTEYDVLDNTTAEVSATGQRVRMTYDQASRLISVSDPLANAIQVRYDPAGSLIETLDGNGHRRRAEYDLLGRLITTSDALGNRTRFQYDPVGNPILEQRPNGARIATQYDALDRPVSVALSGGATETTTYDATSNVIARSSAAGTQTTTYDLLGRAVEMRDSTGHTVQWRYDAAGRRTTTIYPDGRASIVAYDANGWPKEIADRLGNTITAAHDANGNLIDLRYPTSALRWNYDSAGQVTSVLNEGNNGAFAAYEYTLDANHNRTQERISALTLGGLVTLEETAYRYDAADRLIQSVRSGATTTRLEQQIRYDAAGNRTAIDVTEGGTSWSQRWRYDIADRLLEQTDSRTGSTTFSHDAAGQRLSATGSIRQQYAYDARGRLIRVTTLDAAGAPQGSQTARYDSLNRRIVVEDRAADGSLRSSEHTLYDEDGWDVLMQTTSGESPQWFVTAPQGMSHLGIEQDGAMRFAHLDGQGSYVAYTDRTGAPTSGLPATYADWGAVERGAEALDGGYGYTGHRHDANGLVYARNRAYDPATATWLTPDPFPAVETEPGSLNRYSYVRGNPITRTDPLGLFDTDLAAAETSTISVQASGAWTDGGDEGEEPTSAGSHARAQRESAVAHGRSGMRCGS
ncbi:MAG TPA: RHS repeat-associated core domain-containing protein, partial [Herpetosiphonaceae bacterium]